MRTSKVNEIHDLFMYIQTSINPTMCKEIWDDRWEHYFDKWNESLKNIIYFWNRLDHINRRKLIDFYEEKMDNEKM